MKAIIFVTDLDSKDPTAATVLDRLCGILLLERHIRTLRRCNITSAYVVAPRPSDIPERHRPKLTSLGIGVEFLTIADAANITGLVDQEKVLFIAGEYLIEKELIQHVASSENEALLADSHPPVTAAEPVKVDETRVSAGCALLPGGFIKRLQNESDCSWHELIRVALDDRQPSVIDIDGLSRYNFSIRRHRRSFWMKIKDRKDLDIAKRALLEGVQKGSLDWPAKFVHAPIENRLVSWLCNFRITPNEITLITIGAAFIVTWLIYSGSLWVGLVGAALVGILDGLDGKLARIKMMTSKLGQLEHLSDVIFEYSWWLAISWVLANGDSSAAIFAAGLVLILCDLADRLIVLIFWHLLGRKYQRGPENYTQFDLAFKRIAGRRNIYIWILLIVGALVDIETAFWLCVFWCVMSVLVRGGRCWWLINRSSPPSEFEITV
ncbi:CDP-alcohol phosphatidyltransferase family protein [Pseudomonadota bacterium]